MHVHEDHRRLRPQLLDLLVGDTEWILQNGLHECAALHIEDADFSLGRLEHDTAETGSTFRVIGRSQHAGLGG